MLYCTCIVFKYAFAVLLTEPFLCFFTVPFVTYFCIDVCNGSSSLLAGPEEIGLTQDYVTDINGE